MNNMTDEQLLSITKPPLHVPPKLGGPIVYTHVYPIRPMPELGFVEYVYNVTASNTFLMTFMLISSADFEATA